MSNPLIAIMRQYERIPISAVIVRLECQGGGLSVQIIRYGGIIARPSCVGATVEDAEISCMEWTHLPDINIDIGGEHYRNEIEPMVRSAARVSNALDAMEVRHGRETHWHFRPCNSAHWEIHTMPNGKTFRLPVQVDGVWSK